MPAPLNVIVAGEPGALLLIEMLPEALPLAVGENFAVKDVLPPAAIVTGSVSPERLNPVPDAVARDMTVFAVPGLLSVMVAVPVLPVATLLKFTVVGLMVSCGCGGSVAIPLSAMVSGEFAALLVIEMLPLALPAVAGANFAVNDATCPGVSVTGVAKPLILKPAPETLADEITTLAVPVFVTATATDSLAPLSRVPKTMLAGVELSRPCVPMPVKAMVSDGFDALLEIVIVPVTFPAAVGTN
jgi:hypothetical protein